MQSNTSMALAMLASLVWLPRAALGENPAWRTDPVINCALQSGADARVRIAKCLQIVQRDGMGGVADARNISGLQRITQNLWEGVVEPIQLLLGAAEIVVSVVQRPSPGTKVIGSDIGITRLSLSGAGTGAFRFEAAVTRTRIAALAIAGPGRSSTASCIEYWEAFENTLERVNVSGCNRGVLYRDDTAAAASSFSNAISNSQIIAAAGADARRTRRAAVTSGLARPTRFTA